MLKIIKKKHKNVTLTVTPKLNGKYLLKKGMKLYSRKSFSLCKTSQILCLLVEFPWSMYA